VTLSVNLDLRLGCPRVLRGMLPYGVRTFLSESLRSDHLPSPESTTEQGFRKEEFGSQETRSGKRLRTIQKEFLASWFPDSLSFF